MKAFVLALVLASAAFAASGPPAPSLEDISKIPHVKIDLRYATTNNFIGENLYGDFKTPYLHEIAAAKLRKAAEELQKIKPGWSLLVLDALRPRSIQRKLYARVKGTEQESYVGEPEKGSVHNFGFAVDLTLADENGKEVDMGTPYDAFNELAQPRHEVRLLKEKKLTRQQVDNRLVLRRAMEKGGFRSIPNEWWHFDALPGSQVRAKFQIVE